MTNCLVCAGNKVCDRTSVSFPDLSDVGPIFRRKKKFAERVVRLSRAQAERIEEGESVAIGVGVEVEAAGGAEGIGGEEAAESRAVEAIGGEI